MTAGNLFARAAELAQARRPFVFATVVAVAAADVGAARGAWDRPPRRHDRGLGRRLVRPAGRRPRGAPRARRRPAATASPLEGRAGRGPARRRDHRARHDLPFRGNAGDLRGTEPPGAAPLGRRHDADRERSRRARVRGRISGHACSIRSPTPGPSRTPSGRPDRHEPRRPSTRTRVRTSSWRRRASGMRRRSPARCAGTPATSGSSPLRRGRPPSDLGCARRPGLPTSGWRRCEPLPGWTSEPRPPRRSPSRSSPSSSRSAAAGPTSSRRPGPATVAGAGAGAGPMTAAPDDHRAARSGLRHDRRPRPRPASRRARRHRLRVLQPRLPDAVREGSRRFLSASADAGAPMSAKETR